MPCSSIKNLITEVTNQTLTLQKLELIEIILPQVESFKSAIGERTERHALLVRWFDRDGAWGVGECSCRPDPYFNGEFVAGARRVIRDFIFPNLPLAGPISEYLSGLTKIRNWPLTVAAVLDAMFDLLRRKGGSDLFDQWDAPKIDSIPVGISFGLFEFSEEAVARVRRAEKECYQRVKFKIHPQMDLQPLFAVREAFPDLAIGFDANGSGAEGDLEFFKALQKLEPVMLEQPFAPSRLDLCTELRKAAPGLSICLDESVANFGDLVAAHNLGALHELNIKPGRVGGPFEVLRIMDYCGKMNIKTWVGGMFETAVGRSLNLRVAARLPQAQAHDLSPSRRYFQRDIAKRPIEMNENGMVEWQDESPVELDEEFLAEIEVAKITLVKDGN